MSLIQCKECSSTISDKADKCPHCGAPNEILIESIKKTKIANTGEKFNLVRAICFLVGAPLLIYLLYTNYTILNICGDKNEYFINDLLLSLLIIPLQAFEFGTYELIPCQTNSTVFLNRLFLGIVVLTIMIRVVNEMRIEHHKDMREHEIKEKKRKP